jgi:flagellin
LHRFLLDSRALAQYFVVSTELHIDSAITTVASLRAGFGSAQNRLESTIRSLAVALENTAAAESQIRDVNFASETAELTRNQVLQQAGVSILSQANVSTQTALSLLG